MTAERGFVSRCSYESNSPLAHLSMHIPLAPPSPAVVYGGAAGSENIRICSEALEPYIRSLHREAEPQPQCQWSCQGEAGAGTGGAPVDPQTVPRECEKKKDAASRRELARARTHSELNSISISLDRSQPLRPPKLGARQAPQGGPLKARKHREPDRSPCTPV
jgi:hypothetical protein